MEETQVQETPKAVRIAGLSRGKGYGRQLATTMVEGAGILAASPPPIPASWSPAGVGQVPDSVVLDSAEVGLRNLKWSTLYQVIYIYIYIYITAMMLPSLYPII